MDLLNPNKTELKRLAELYIISNTPHFLYRKMRNDHFVQMIGECPSELIINVILKLGKQGISEIDELAYLYALYIALTLKSEYVKVRDFYNTDGAIGFEWFPEIKSIYLSSTIPTNYIILNAGNPSVDYISPNNDGQKKSNFIEINVSEK